MLTASLAIGVSGISGSAPEGTRNPSGSLTGRSIASSERMSGSGAVHFTSSAPRVYTLPESGDPWSIESRTSGDVARSVTLAGRGAVQPAAVSERDQLWSGRDGLDRAYQQRSASDQSQRPDLHPRSETCRSARPALRRAIAERRAATHRWQDALGYPHTRTAFRERTAIGCAYLKFLRARWSERADSAYRVWVSLRDPREAICHVFGIYCSEALAVARCESGWAYSVNATNGQYLGMFQMGSYARTAYGHGPSAIEQARAAYRYFVASGRNWGPWSCKP